MKQFLILSTIFCLLTGTTNGQQSNATLKLDFITKIPSVIDGCSGLYTYDATSLKKEKYIIVWDLQEIAFIKVQGKEIKLQTTDKKELPKSVYKATFKGGGYTVILTTKTVKKTGEESSLDNGTLEIIKGSDKLLIKIHGESGC